MTTLLYPTPVADSLPEIPAVSLEAAAGQLATAIMARAVRTSLAAGWQGPPSSAHPDSGKIGVLQPGLFDGSSGIAVFLAAYSKVTGCSEARGIALGALYPLRCKLLQLADRSVDGGGGVRHLGGGFLGVGSFLYCLSQVAVLLDDAALAGDTLHVAQRLLTPDRLAEQTVGEVIQGVAGLLLAAISVHAMATRFALDDDVLTSTRACGNVLRGIADDGFDQQRSGFGHGLSGIAYALIRLHELDPDGGWLSIAHQALAAERAMFDPRCGDWLHPTTGRPVEQNAWCHGATGMFLTRAAALRRGLFPHDEPSRSDFDTCRQATLDQATPLRDHLCCGTLGLALTLQQAGIDLDRLDWIAQALGLGLEVATRCPDQLILQRPEDEVDEGWLDPSMMNGLAGIGMGLLRLTDPSLPNVLTLQ